eukprot:2542879-Amphidinium_carterae.1
MKHGQQREDANRRRRKRKIHNPPCQPPQWTDCPGCPEQWMPLPGVSTERVCVCVWRTGDQTSPSLYPSADLLLFHCVPTRDVLDSTCDKSLLVASPVGFSESQTKMLLEKGFYVGKCEETGETSSWLLASRPESLAVCVELTGIFNMDTVLQSVWQHLYPDNSTCEQCVSSGEWLSSTHVLAQCSWRELVDEIVAYLTRNVIPVNSARTGVGNQNACESDQLRTLTLGATTARRYGVTPTSTDPTWLPLLPYLMELA